MASVHEFVSSVFVSLLLFFLYLVRRNCRVRKNIFDESKIVFEENKECNLKVFKLERKDESSYVDDKIFNKYIDSLGREESYLNGEIWSQNDENQDNFEEIIQDSNEKVIEEVVQNKFNTGNVYSLNESDAHSINSDSFHSSTSDPVDSYDLDDGFFGDFKGEFDAKTKDQTNDGYKPKDEMDHRQKDTDFKDKNLANNSTNTLKSSWEHQELIEQLKIEIKKVRAIGLPTIYEESESPPKILEEIKPWKVEEGCQHVGHNLCEIYKFYKVYKEKMRKFDIFSYEKMYATGFLQLDDTFQSVSSSRSLLPEIKTLVRQSFLRNKGKKSEKKNIKKFIKELQNDLEVVYVGQMCLSWEILRWQYEKVLDMWESDQLADHQFLDVFGEFRQFLVLIRKFIKEEPFRGTPRVQNYVKSRVFRNLLQVPLVREDDPKNTRNDRSSEAMSDDMLVEILEESIRLFWCFVRADNKKRKSSIEFRKPEDSKLFMEVQQDLQKKERKLKEQLTRRSCILRKLGRDKKKVDLYDEVVYFFYQVDLKLVERVLQMSRLTYDQLTWCKNQLKKVMFFNRKVNKVKTTLLLFPC